MGITASSSWLLQLSIPDSGKGGPADGKESRYILGVPGNYYSNEKYMASMFGFPHFVLAKRQSRRRRFGYWYTDIRLDHFTA